MNTLKIFFRLSRFFLALVAGVILGYFVLLHPLINFSITDIQWPKFLMQDINAYLYDRGILYISIATMIFILLIPNIFLLAIIVSLAMGYTSSPRTIFYSIFIPPLLDGYLTWVKIIRLKERLELNGVNTNIGTLIRAEHLDAKVFGMFLTYSLFSIFVFVLFKIVATKEQRQRSS